MKLTTSFIGSLLILSGVYGQMEPVVPGTPAPTTAPATTQDTQAAAVKDALTKYNMLVSSGNVDEIIKMIDTTNDVQKQAVQQMAKLSSTGASVYDVALKHFGKEKLEADQVTKDAFPTGFPVLPVEQIQARTSGDKAVLMSEDGSPLPLAMIKKDGNWLFDSSFLQITNEKELQSRSEMLDAVTQAMDTIKADINAGLFKSADESIVLLEYRVKKAVQAQQMKRIKEMSTTAPAADGATGPVGPAIPEAPAAK